jgi:hypothetical protein
MVQPSRHANVDDVDVVAAHRVLPVVAVVLPPPPSREIAPGLPVRIAGALLHRLKPYIEELRNVGPGIAVRLAHEPCANDAHIHCFQRILSFFIADDFMDRIRGLSSAKLQFS